MRGLNVTDVRKEWIELVWSTVRETMLAKGFYRGMRTQKHPCVCRKKKLPWKGVHSWKCLCFKHLRQALPADSRALDIAVTEHPEAHADNTGHNKEGHSHQAAGKSEWPHPHLRPAKTPCFALTVIWTQGQHYKLLTLFSSFFNMIFVVVGGKLIVPNTHALRDRGEGL